MDTKKWEQLVTLYLNEGNEEKARALFHDIIVEKSREIYESMLDLEEGDPVTGLMSEISMEEEGMNEDDMDAMEAEDADMDMDAMDDMEDMEDMGDEEGDMDDMGDVDDADMDDMDEPADEEDLEDRVVDIEDKLDQLMSEFEELMGKEEGEEEAADDEMDAADDEMDAAADDEEAAADDEEEAADEEAADEEMMESVSLHKYNKPKGGDNGSGTRSPALTHPLVNQRSVPKIGGGSAEGRKAPAVKPGGNYGNSTDGSKRLKPVSAPRAGEQAHGKSPVAVVKESQQRPATKKPVAKK